MGSGPNFQHACTWWGSPHQQAILELSADCPIIQLNSDTTYLKIASDSISPTNFPHFQQAPSDAQATGLQTTLRAEI